MSRPVLWDQGVWDGCSPSHCSFLNSHQRAQAAWHVYEDPQKRKAAIPEKGECMKTQNKALGKARKLRQSAAVGL